MTLTSNLVLRSRTNVFRGHELFVAHIQDQIEQVLRYGTSSLTSFLTPVEQEIVKQLCSKKIFVSFYGGYENAVRKMAFLSVEEREPDFDYVILSSTYQEGKYPLRHRDLLGALMHTGLKRGQLGDLAITEDQVFLVCKENMSSWIQERCHRVGSVFIDLNSDYYSSFPSPKIQEILINVPSFRMDAIISGLAKVSRSKALDMIRKGEIKLNDVVLEENEQLCNNDVVSIHGVGRFHVLQALKETRKKRWILSFEKYIT